MSDRSNITVVEQVNGKDCEIHIDTYDFLKRRVVYLNAEIDSKVAQTVASQLRYLDKKSTDPIILIINSPGGLVDDGMFIYDVMKSLSAEVITVAAGKAASMAALLLAAGTKGKRYALPNATIMIHQPSSFGIGGQATDIYKAAERIQMVKKKQVELMAQECLRTDVEKIGADMERDFFLTAQQAKRYGIIDCIGWPRQDF